MLRNHKNTALKLHKHAEVFAALGDRTRLTLVAKLADGRSRSISDLTEGTRLTRQAVTKHLRILEEVGVVHNSKAGRETLYELDAKPMRSLQECLEVIGSQWDDALGRLKRFVED